MPITVHAELHDLPYEESSRVAFELKTVETLVHRHRSQLVNYLLLTGLHHGKWSIFGQSSLSTNS